jgi:hypothetical protein
MGVALAKLRADGTEDIGSGDASSCDFVFSSVASEE